MYKLNILKGHQFFDFYTPVNFFANKNFLQKANEIKPDRRNSQGRVIRAQSLPKGFWFRDFDDQKQKKVKQSNKLKRENKHIIQNPIYFKRKDVFENLTKYRSRAGTPNPSKKWKKFRNLHVYREQVQKCQNDVGEKKNFLDSLNLIVPTQSVTPPRSARSSFVSPTQSIMLPNFVKRTPQQKQMINQIPILKLSRLQSNRTEIKDNDISQNLQPFADIQLCLTNIEQSNNKINICNSLSPRKKFEQDSYRLYGLDSTNITARNKLKVSDINKFVTSQDCNSPRLLQKGEKSGSLTQRVKPSKQQNILADLIKKQKLQHSSKVISVSPKTNMTNSKDSLIMRTYFPSIKKQDI